MADAKEISRRGFVKAGVVAAAGVAAASVATGCAPSVSGSSSSENGGSIADSGVSMTPGTYTAQADGLRGPWTVTVSTSDSAITGISAKAEDSKHMVAAVLTTMVPEIIKNQSLEVDTVTGATFSSTALLNGVRDCLTQAGVSENDMDTDCTTSAVKTADEEFDVVVVGSGGAGLSTAIQLAKRGAHVALLEKLGFVGGTTSYSSGGVWTANTAFNEMTGYNFTPDSLVEHMYNASEAERGTLNEDLIRNIAEVAGDVYTEYKADGAPWDMDHYTFGDALQEMPVSWPNMFYTTNYENNAGMTLIDSLKREALLLGVDIRVNSPVSELVVDGGEVTGVKVDGRDKIYTINAKKVVLATGGFQRNTELVSELAPEQSTMVPFTCAGSTGDGITMGREAGAAIAGRGLAGSMGLDSKIGYVGLLGATTYCSNLRVNLEGKRFYDETTHYSRTFPIVCAQTDGTTFAIADSTNAMVDSIEELVERGYAFKADTLDELASAAGIDSALTETVEAYNAVAASGQDDPDFGVANASMTPATTAPFYAVKARPVSFGCIAGLATDDACNVVDESGNQIGNLFAAGELIAGNLMSDVYTGSGSEIGPSMYEGRLIAERIAEELGL
jgi:succinate dehydrogenase/fumarate reductase flavoprotein subunit/uncharacterized protein with FMN-binding domain